MRWVVFMLNTIQRDAINRDLLEALKALYIWPLIGGEMACMADGPIYEISDHGILRLVCVLCLHVFVYILVEVCHCVTFQYVSLQYVSLQYVTLDTCPFNT